MGASGRLGPLEAVRGASGSTSHRPHFPWPHSPPRRDSRDVSEPVPSGAISVAEAAKVRAILDAAGDQSALFRDKPMEAELWAEVEERLLAELAEEVDRGELARMEEYQRVYRAVRAEVERHPPSAAAEVAVVPEGSSAAAVVTVPVQVAQATFQKPAEVAAFDPDATAEADVRAIITGLRNRGLPFEQGGPPAPPPASPPQADVRSGATEEMDMRAFRSVATPAVPFAAPPPPPPPKTDEFDPDETAMVDGSKVLEGLRSRGVPFDGTAPARPPAQPVPQKPREPNEGTGTVELDVSRFRRGGPRRP